MGDEKFIYIKSIVVDGILFKNMLAVMGISDLSKNYFIMPMVPEHYYSYLGLHNNNNEECRLMPSITEGRYALMVDSEKWTDKNYVVLKNISSLLRV